jgi:hypothetical protein
MSTGVFLSGIRDPIDLYNGRMTYREDYEKAASEVERLLQESEGLEEKILEARKRMAALETLLKLDGGVKGALDVRKYALTLGVRDTLVSNAIRRLMKTGRTFTPREIRTELEQTGWDFGASSNPLATINAVCVSLTESGELRRIKKHGRTAWQRAKR